MDAQPSTSWNVAYLVRCLHNGCNYSQDSSGLAWITMTLLSYTDRKGRAREREREREMREPWLNFVCYEIRYPGEMDGYSPCNTSTVLQDEKQQRIVKDQPCTTRCKWWAKKGWWGKTTEVGNYCWSIADSRIPSRKLIYPLQKVPLKMSFLYQWWDMSVPRRVSRKQHEPTNHCLNTFLLCKIM